MSSIATLVGVTIGVMMLVITFIIIPMVGDQMDQSITVTSGSEWNHSQNSDIPTGYDLWTDLSGMITVAAIVVIVGMLFKVFKSIKG